MGRPQFAQQGTRGSGQTIATTSRPELDLLDLSDSTTVAAGETVTTEVYAPTGSIYRLAGAEVNIGTVSGATSGTHQFDVRPLGTSVIAVRGESNHNTPITLRAATWESADQVDLPKSGDIQESINSVMATENSPIEFRYINDTDVDRSQIRYMYVTVEEESY